MSARKIDAGTLVKVPQTTQCLTLPASAVRVRQNGIEFRHSKPMAPWTEMTLALQRPGEEKKMECQGVIVACDGDGRQGFRISMLFTNLSAQTRAQLLAYS